MCFLRYNGGGPAGQKVKVWRSCKLIWMGPPEKPVVLQAEGPWNEDKLGYILTMEPKIFGSVPLVFHCFEVFQRKNVSSVTHGLVRKALTPYSSHLCLNLHCMVFCCSIRCQQYPPQKTKKHLVTLYVKIKPGNFIRQHIAWLR